jgi:hypothetical protein
MHGLEDPVRVAQAVPQVRLVGALVKAGEKLDRIHRLNCGYGIRVAQNSLFCTAMVRESAQGITSGSATCGPVK